MRRFNQIISAPGFRAKRGGHTKKNGLGVVYLATATFDTAGNDSSGVSNKTIAAHGLGVYIPDNAVIINSWVDVVTTFADGVADLATIALSVQGANDLVAAITIADATNDVWDAGIQGTLVGNWALDGNALSAIAMGVARAGTFIKTTAERELTATVAAVALTAGKLVLYVEYVLSD